MDPEAPEPPAEVVDRQNNEDSDDDEEEEEEEEEDDDGAEEEDGLQPDVLEGGVADADPLNNDAVQHAAQADITLYFTCAESFQHLYPTDPHPILQPNVTVQIGLGKNTKLEVVMKRYIHVCNEHRPEGTPELRLQDVDFSHVQLLDPTDTPEAAALMKHDRIRVSREHKQQREKDLERRRLQRESDKEFFEQLWKRALTQHDGKNVALLCRKTSKEESDDKKCLAEKSSPSGLQVLLCDGAIVSKRCKWLGALIARATFQKQRRQPTRSQHHSDTNEEDDTVQPVNAEIPGDADFGLIAPDVARIENDDVQVIRDGPAAAKIENDDDEEENKNLIHVQIEFSREVVCLLLEYIYTNRVVPFGVDAFVAACRTRPSEKTFEGPIPPYDIDRKQSRRWPNKGLPVVSFEVCTAAIQLGETASLRRFSYMAEVAAAQLVTPRNVVSALALCEKLRQYHGNPLSRLRRAAMEVVLRSRHVLSTQSFNDSLVAQGKDLIPTLLAGAMEAIEAEDDDEHRSKRKKTKLEEAPDQWRRSALAYFPLIDRKDKKARDRERLNRRRELASKGRRGAYLDESTSKSQGLKRSARHLYDDTPVDVFEEFQSEAMAHYAVDANCKVERKKRARRAR